ncbi:MAG: hypothetical protein EBU23_18310 [Mycobacteriaceae bacterium]|jgi:hypothetical protein|nr:hypothetical protein [Mycobacteriaceae bacterium]
MASVSDALRSLTADGRLLFLTRFVRLFAYGALSIVLVLYLVGLGFSETDAGFLLTAFRAIGQPSSPSSPP